MKTIFALTCVCLLLASVGGCSSGDSVSENFEPVSDDSQTAEVSSDINPFTDGEVAQASYDAVDAGPQAIETAPNLQSIPDDAAPDIILRNFLKALQSDNVRLAENLLTDRARVETRRAQMEVRRVPAADYKVGLTHFATQAKEVAHIDTLWTDTDESGASVSFDITWVLRHQQNTWRVAGMLTAPSETEAKVFLNFEAPLEMVALVGEVESGEATDGSTVRQASFEQPAE